ncbi:hypothetical protein LXL04_018234 [Taraxacum kok-saghyz]
MLEKDSSAKVAERVLSSLILEAFEGRCPRPGVPQQQWEDLCRLLQYVRLFSVSDRYVRDLEPHGEFTVASARRLVYSSLLGISSCATRWNGWCPKRIAAWWNVNLPPVLSVRNLLLWGESVPLTVVKRRRFEAMVAVALWILWNFRNKLIFGTSKPRKDELFDDIRYWSYFWIHSRDRKSNLD